MKILQIFYQRGFFRLLHQQNNWLLVESHFFIDDLNTPISFYKVIILIRALYQAWLLPSLNSNHDDFSTNISLWPSNTTPTPLPFNFEDLIIHKIHTWGMSLPTGLLNYTKKSARPWDLTIPCGTKFMSYSGLDELEKFVLTIVRWPWNYDLNFLDIVTNAKENISIFLYLNSTPLNTFLTKLEGLSTLFSHWINT